MHKLKIIQKRRFIYAKQKQTYRYRKQLLAAKGEKEGERGKIRGIELRDTKYYYKTDKQQDILYSTGNYSQYLIIAFNGI